MKTFCLLLPVVVMAGCGQPQEAPSDVQFLASGEYAALGLPFSEAVRVDNMLYLSGQVGNRPGLLELIPGGVEAETRQALANIARLLEQSGSGMDRVVKCTVYLADIADWPAVNTVYRTFFEPPYPARSAVAGSGLAIGARVEIECIATVG